MSDFRERLARLQADLVTQHASGAVFAGTDNMRYLSGWQEGGHERFVGLMVPMEGEPTFLVPKMNAPQARENPAGFDKVVGWDDADGWTEPATSILTEWNLSANSLLLIDDELHSVHLLAMQSLFPTCRFQSAGATMTRLREVKTEAELQAMLHAAEMIDAVYEETVLMLREGITELEFGDFVLAAIRRRSATPSFTPLICFGENTALPHHHTGNRKLRLGDMVIIDIGSVYDGYASDITRTVSYGQPADSDVEKVYEIVRQAHYAARNLARPGVSGEDVDSAARMVITDAGYGKEFLHRTGHGIGLSVHEPPNIVRGNTADLKPGMCFSVEPGIYLEGRFGVRIENIVTVTDVGCRSLNADASPTLRVVE